VISTGDFAALVGPAFFAGMFYLVARPVAILLWVVQALAWGYVALSATKITPIAWNFSAIAIAFLLFRFLRSKMLEPRL
jgi:hypothetical protein